MSDPFEVIFAETEEAVGVVDTAAEAEKMCGALPQTKGGTLGVAKPRPRESQRLRGDAAHDEVPNMRGPPLSSSILVVPKNENETRG